VAAARRRVRCWAAVSLILGAALGFSIVWRPRPLLVWNASPSSRVGLYLLNAWSSPGLGDMAVAWPPAAMRRLADARHYLPASVPLVKPVAAVAGNRICARQDRIYVDGRLVVRRRSRDPSGRFLPWWSGCVRLGAGELLLLSRGRPDAFDGRYFGLTRGSELVGRARLLWAKRTRGSADG
jgi:type IV secretory pathway protease TraF